MFNPDTSAYFDSYLRSFKTLQQPSSVEVKVMHVRSVAEVDLVIAQLGRNPDSGLIAGSDVFIVGARKTIIKSAEEHRVPVISPYRQFVVEGSLMSYGPEPPISSGVQANMLIAFSRAKRRAICQCRRRTSMSSLSILERPKHLASRFASYSCCLPTR